jgi:hypothetical protein
MPNTPEMKEARTMVKPMRASAETVIAIPGLVSLAQRSTSW